MGEKKGRVCVCVCMLLGRHSIREGSEAKEI